MPGQRCYVASMLTRTQVARRIRRSVATVRRMEGRTLHPHIDPRGIRLFDPQEVEAESERIEESGRALDDDRHEAFSFRVGHSSDSDEAQLAETEHRLREARRKIAHLEDALERTRAEGARWRNNVEISFASFVDALGAVDDDAIDAMDELASSICRP